MNVTKSLSTAGVGAAIVVGSMLAVNLASAQTSEHQAEVVDRIATELNVDSAEVQGVFDTLHEERQAELETQRAEFVAGLVSDGTLTQEQADELAVLSDENKAEVEALQESGAERSEIKSLMEENRTAVEAWAEAEGIDLDAIRPERGEAKGGMGHHGGRMGHHGHGPDGAEDAASDIETSSEEV